MKFVSKCKTYFEYRKQIYASINGRLGNFVRLSESKLLRKNELEQLKIVIEETRKLSQIIKSNELETRKSEVTIYR